MVQKTSATTLIFTSADGRGRVEVGSQIDFTYDLGNGAASVVSLPLTALAALDELFRAVMVDEDVAALIVAHTPPEPEPEPEPEGDDDPDYPEEP